jgi:hypothetical protein
MQTINPMEIPVLNSIVYIYLDLVIFIAIYSYTYVVVLNSLQSTLNQLGLFLHS